MNSVKVKIEGLNFENFLFDLSAANIKMKNIKRIHGMLLDAVKYYSTQMAVRL